MGEQQVYIWCRRWKSRWKEMPTLGLMMLSLHFSSFPCECALSCSTFISQHNCALVQLSK